MTQRLTQLWMVALVALGMSASAAFAGELVIPLNRAELVSLKRDASEVMVADPETADIHVHSPRRISILGKSLGRTNVRILDENKNVVHSFDVFVTYDLPAIRKALKEFLPNEAIGVKLINTNIALVGEASSAAVVERAEQIVGEFMGEYGQSSSVNVASASGSGANMNPNVTQGVAGNNRLIGPNLINLLKVTAGQQVMLRVRVGEIQRTALKRLGTSISGVEVNGGFSMLGSSGNLLFDSGVHTYGVGGIALDQESAGIGGFNYEGSDFSLSARLEALETQGLFKVLAEPNLVALSGEQAEFLAGGEFPIPIVSGAGATAQSGVEYKPYGVTVQFVPYVLAKNRIRLAVAPEVSEISTDVTATIGGSAVPALSTRRAKTTVELAPGESFMIAGLLRDQLNSTVRQIPGLGEIPIFGALLRSTSYQRKESELVIAVTPYLVDPLKGEDVRLPTDDFKPASMMDMMFYGALGAVTEESLRRSESPGLEGSVGFMVE